MRVFGPRLAALSLFLMTGLNSPVLRADGPATPPALPKSDAPQQDLTPEQKLKQLEERMKAESARERSSTRPTTKAAATTRPAPRRPATRAITPVLPSSAQLKTAP